MQNQARTAWEELRLVRRTPTGRIRAAGVISLSGSFGEPHPH